MLNNDDKIFIDGLVAVEQELKIRKLSKDIEQNVSAIGHEFIGERNSPETQKRMVAALQNYLSQYTEEFDVKVVSIGDGTFDLSIRLKPMPSMIGFDVVFDVYFTP